MFDGRHPLVTLVAAVGLEIPLLVVQTDDVELEDVGVCKTDRERIVQNVK